MASEAARLNAELEQLLRKRAVLGQEPMSGWPYHVRGEKDVTIEIEARLNYVGFCSDLERRIMAEVPQRHRLSQTEGDLYDGPRDYVVGAAEQWREMKEGGETWIVALRRWARWLLEREWIGQEFYDSLDFDPPETEGKVKQREEAWAQKDKFEKRRAAILDRVGAKAQRGGAPGGAARHRGLEKWNVGLVRNRYHADDQSLAQWENELRQEDLL